jgi:hypothetical protein
MRNKYTLLAMLGLFGGALSAQAQWVTQTLPLKAGWNAVYLYVQPEPRALDTVFTNLPVDKVYKWQRPEAAIQFDVDPGHPFPRPGDWQTWYPPGGDQQYLSNLGDLLANQAYYIHVTNSAGCTLNLKGTPVLNPYSWPGNAYSLYGLPVPSSSAPTFTGFFSASSDIATPYGAASRIYTVSTGGYEYAVFQPNIQAIARGQAYWILCNQVSSYAGPMSVQIDGQDNGWMDFRAGTSAKTISIRNNSTNATRRVVLRQQVSETAPGGDYPAVAGSVPLLYGVMNWDPDNLGTQYLPLPTALTNVLAPGGVLKIDIRPNPAALANPVANSVYQSVLAVSDLDSDNRTSVNQFIGVRFVASAQATGDPTGLWVGDVLVTGVNRARVGGLATNWDTSVVTPVERPFSFRILMEVASNGTAKLLQQAFIAWLPTAVESVDGMDGTYLAGTNVILHTLAEATAFVAAHPSGTVSRISAINFPFMNPVTLSGTFGTSNSGSFFMPYNDRVNPFVHLYSPDHDNLETHNGQAANLSAGNESYDVTRTVSFRFSATDSSSNRPPDWGISQWGGTYSETVDGLLTPGASIRATGVFTIQKISGPSI